MAPENETTESCAGILMDNELSFFGLDAQLNVFIALMLSWSPELTSISKTFQRFKEEIKGPQFKNTLYK